MMYVIGCFLTTGFLLVCLEQWAFSRMKQATEDMDMIEELNRKLASITHKREQLEADEVWLWEFHGVIKGSCEADELSQIVWSGMQYNEAIRRVMHIKKTKYRSNNFKKPTGE